MSEVSHNPEQQLPFHHAVPRVYKELDDAILADALEQGVRNVTEKAAEQVEKEPTEILETLIQEALVHYDNGQNFEAAKSFASGLIHAHIIKPRHYSHVVAEIEHNSLHETRDAFIASLKQIATNDFFKGNGLPLQPLSML